jgi:predicted nucleotidyltransferase
MATKTPSPFPFPPKRIYMGASIPMRVIRRYARAIAEEFQPDKIILFGSYAYGTPNEDSDVDLLVIMPCYDEHTQSVRIQWRLSAPFPMDLLVRKPKEMKWRLEEGESFTTTIMSKGKVLYEKSNKGVGKKGRTRLRARKARKPKPGSVS